MSDFNLITTAGRAWVSAANSLQNEPTLVSALDLARRHEGADELARTVMQNGLNLGRQA